MNPGVDREIGWGIRPRRRIWLSCCSLFLDPPHLFLELMERLLPLEARDKELIEEWRLDASIALDLTFRSGSRSGRQRRHFPWKHSPAKVRGFLEVPKGLNLDRFISSSKIGTGVANVKEKGKGQGRQDMKTFCKTTYHERR